MLFGLRGLIRVTHLQLLRAWFLSTSGLIFKENLFPRTIWIQSWNTRDVKLRLSFLGHLPQIKIEILLILKKLRTNSHAVRSRRVYPIAPCRNQSALLTQVVDVFALTLPLFA